MTLKVKTWDTGRARSLKIALFHGPYWSAVVSIDLSCSISGYLALSNTVTLKSELQVTQGH